MPPQSNNPSTGTRTQAETVDPLPHPTTAIQTVTLRLRGVPAERRRIRWAADVIDNEGLGRKSSKLCCIYHKTREVGESSSEEDSDSDSSSDSDEASDGDGADDGRARMGGKGKRKDNGHQHEDGEEECSGDDGVEGGSWKGKKRTRTARNAYEKTPKKRGANDVKK